MQKNLFLAVASAVALNGCAVSGLGASSKFSCKAAPGVNCQSISGVHQNLEAKNLPFQLQSETAAKDAAAPVLTVSDPAGKMSPRHMGAEYSGMPVRQPPKVLRVWVAPYEDESGDLFDQSFFYTVVHSGKWMIEANRDAIGGQYRPVYPLQRSAPKTEKEEGEEGRLQRPNAQPGDYKKMIQRDLR